MGGILANHGFFGDHLCWAPVRPRGPSAAKLVLLTSVQHTCAQPPAQGTCLMVCTSQDLKDPLQTTSPARLAGPRAGPPPPTTRHLCIPESGFTGFYWGFTPCTLSH